MERRWKFLFAPGLLSATVVGLGWAGVIPPGVIGLPAGAWPLVALGLSLVWLFLFWVLWRCPACGRYPGFLGPNLDCRHCGVPILRSEMSQEEWARWDAELKWDHALKSGTANLVGIIFLLPFGTFFLTLFIGLWGSLREASHKAQGNDSDLPLLAVLGILVALSAFGVYSARWSRRGFEQGGMPLLRIRRLISGAWMVTGGVMILAGLCVFGYIALTSSPGLPGAAVISQLDPVDRPLPLEIAFSIYILAGALVLGRGWKALGGAKGDAEIHAGGNQEAAKEAEWSRRKALISASNSQAGVLLVVIGGFILTCLIGMGKGTGALRLVSIGFFSLASCFGAVSVGRSRPRLAAAGYSPEQARHEIASTWMFGGALMILFGAFALGLMFPAADLLEPAEIRSMGSAFAVYTLTGVLLLWRNRRSRRPA